MNFNAFLHGNISSNLATIFANVYTSLFLLSRNILVSCAVDDIVVDYTNFKI